VRRFPPPWSVEDTGAAFVVKDAGGQKLDYFYYEEEPGRRSTAKMLTKDEARRIAANFGQAAGVGTEGLGRVLINSPCPLYPPKADIPGDYSRRVLLAGVGHAASG
jgi:hypothetical protein